MQACMNTIIICGACDEEMFTREQRFMYVELRDYLDQIYEEMTEQQREHLEGKKINSDKKGGVYQKTRLAEDNGESTSVMRPFFNQNNSEVSAPVMALNVEDIDEDNIFAGTKPNIVFNSSFSPEKRGDLLNVSKEVSFRGNRESDRSIRDNTLQDRSIRESKEKSFLDTGRSFLNKSQAPNLSFVKNSYAENKSFLGSQNPPDNRSFLGSLNKQEKPSVMNNRSVIDRNFLSPTRDLVSANRSAIVVDRSNNRFNPVASANASFLNANRSFEQPEERSLMKAFESNSHSRSRLNSFGNSESIDNTWKFNEEGPSFSEEDPIQVYNESSIEMEPDGNRPVFRK